MALRHESAQVFTQGAGALAQGNSAGYIDNGNVAGMANGQRGTHRVQYTVALCGRSASSASTAGSLPWLGGGLRLSGSAHGWPRRRCVAARKLIGSSGRLAQMYAAVVSGEFDQRPSRANIALEVMFLLIA